MFYIEHPPPLPPLFFKVFYIEHSALFGIIKVSVYCNNAVLRLRRGMKSPVECGRFRDQSLVAMGQEHRKNLRYFFKFVKKFPLLEIWSGLRILTR